MAQTDPQNSEQDRVIVFDTTLRDAEQTPGASLTVRDKLEIAHQLARLQVDVIDLYIMHWPDKLTSLDESLAAMDQAVQQGKIRFAGSSNHDAAQLCEMLWIAEQNKLAPIVSSQIPFSLLRREFQHDLKFCAEKNICVTPYQPLQGGLLTGKYRRGEQPPGESRGSDKPQWLWELNDELFDRLEALEQLAGTVNPRCVAVEDDCRGRAQVGTEMDRALENQEFPGGKVNAYRLEHGPVDQLAAEAGGHDFHAPDP